MGCMFAQFVAMVRCQGPAALRHRSTTLVRVKKDFIECMLMAVIHEKLLSQLEAAGVCVTPQIRVRTAPGRRMTGPVEGGPPRSDEVSHRHEAVGYAR